MTNFYQDEILDADDCPSCAAPTPCFRREAGSWGAHVHGLNRLHQFDKVELVKWTDADSMEELEKLRENVESTLQKLDLPYRVLRMCTGEIGSPMPSNTTSKFSRRTEAGGNCRAAQLYRPGAPVSAIVGSTVSL